MRKTMETIRLDALVAAQLGVTPTEATGLIIGV